MKRLILTVCIFVAATFLEGCRTPASQPPIVQRPPDYVPIRRIKAGVSNEGRSIRCIIVGQGWDVTFMLAAIHGDEPAGTLLLKRLAGHLKENPDLMYGRRAVLIPVANPDGLARQSRLNAAGVDLNRNFPDVNRDNDNESGPAALSEPEALAIDEIITEYAPERIVSIHQFTETGPEALSERFPKGCIDYDGPAKRLAKKMAKHCDLPVKKLGARPGSLGSYAGLTLEVPVITIELPMYADMLDPDSLWEKYGKALAAAVLYPSER